MAEFSEAEPSGDQVKEVAALRWKAVEAFNCTPGLTDTARRLGVHLICKMDTRTRACYPGQTRLSAELGCNESSITRAKKQLKDKGLISWELPAGRRQVIRPFKRRLKHALVHVWDWSKRAPVHIWKQTIRFPNVQLAPSKRAMETLQTCIQSVPNVHRCTPILPKILLKILLNGSRASKAKARAGMLKAKSASSMHSTPTRQHNQTTPQPERNQHLPTSRPSSLQSHRKQSCWQARATLTSGGSRRCCANVVSKAPRNRCPKLQSRKQGTLDDGTC
jgi:hypothetical protein